MSKESQIQVISSEEQAEYVQLYLFRELLNNTNKLERIKDGMDHRGEHIIFECNRNAFEMYDKYFYKDTRRRGIANEIVVQEKRHSEQIREESAKELDALYKRPEREGRAVFVERHMRFPYGFIDV